MNQQDNIEQIVDSIRGAEHALESAQGHANSLRRALDAAPGNGMTVPLELVTANLELHISNAVAEMAILHGSAANAGVSQGISVNEGNVIKPTGGGSDK